MKARVAGSILSLLIFFILSPLSESLDWELEELPPFFLFSEEFLAICDNTGSFVSISSSLSLDEEEEEEEEIIAATGGTSA